MARHGWGLPQSTQFLGGGLGDDAPVIIQGSGALVAPTPAAAGTGSTTSIFSGTGALVGPTGSAYSSGALTISGTGSLAAPTARMLATVPGRRGATRGLLLRGAGGTRRAARMPFTQGVVSVSMVMPFAQIGGNETASVIMPFWIAGDASASVVMPFSTLGYVGAKIAMPFAILDGTTGVDPYGGIIVPNVGYEDNA